MDTTMPRFNLSTVTVAIIVAVGLIAAALIMAYRPAAVASTSLVRPAAVPHMSQEKASEQFRAQVLAAPSLHTYVYKGVYHTLADAKVTSVSYDDKADRVGVMCDWVWKPTMPVGGPDGTGADFYNDGYGHYGGRVILNLKAADWDGGEVTKVNGPSADVTLR